MINISQSQVISHKQASALLSVMLILTIVNHLCILDSFGAEMKKLSNKFVISTVLIEGDPVRAAQGSKRYKYMYIQWEVSCLHRGRLLYKHIRLPFSLVLAIQ